MATVRKAAISLRSLARSNREGRAANVTAARAPVVQAPPRDVIDQIQIPIPCKVSWDDMTGDEQVRHCGQCRQNVYNIAAFTRGG